MQCYEYDAIPCSPCNTILWDAIYLTMQYHAMLYNTTQYHDWPPLFCFLCLSRSPTLAPEIGAIVIHSTQNWRRFSYLYALWSKNLYALWSKKSSGRTWSNNLVPFFIVSTMLLDNLGMKGSNYKDRSLYSSLCKHTMLFRVNLKPSNGRL